MGESFAFSIPPESGRVRAPAGESDCFRLQTQFCGRTYDDVIAGCHKSGVDFDPSLRALGSPQFTGLLLLS